ncbi:hypothetical protein ACEOB3_11410 [Aeromonas dhakensis]|uniref:hypothetical protein n=1 Tax=Aeromonas dhakensis TaxID=196024 RepID=UPI00358DCF1F
MFILETERLRLRDIRLDDEAAFVATTQDEHYQRCYSEEDGLFIMVTRRPQLGLRAARPIPRTVRAISWPDTHSDDPHRKMIC